MKLFTKLLLGVSVIFLVTVLLSGTIVYRSINSSLQEEIGNIQLVEAKEAMGEIDHLLYERYRDIELISHLGYIQKYLNLYTNKEEALINKVKIEDKKSIYNHQSEIGDKTDFEREFHKLKSLSGPWDILYIVNKNGDIVLSDDKKNGKNISSNLKDFLAYKEVLKGKIYYSDLVYCPKTNQPTIIFAAPIYNNTINSRGINGVVIGHISWPLILENLEKYQGSLSLYNSKGILIGNSYREDVNKILKENDSSSKIIQYALTRKPQSVILPDLHSHAISLVSYVRQTGYLNYHGSNWILTIQTPIKTIFSSATKTALRTVLILFIFLIIIAFLGLYFFRTLFIKPISHLTNTIKAIISGDLKQRAKIDTNDEIGELARNFNFMTEKLFSSIEYSKNIIKILPTSLFLVNKQGKILEANKSASQLFESEYKSLLDKNIGDLLLTTNSEARNVFEKIGFGKILSFGHLSNLRLRLKNKKGKEFPILVSATVLANQNSDVIIIIKDLRELSNYAKKRLAEITPILHRVATGDFSQSIKIPEKEDEFTEHLIVLKLMINDFKEMIKNVRKKSEELEAQNEELEEFSAELEEVKSSLEIKVKNRTADLKKSEESLQLKVSEKTKELSELNKHLESEVEKRTIELQDKLRKLSKFNKIAVGRELKMIQLKKEIRRLKKVIESFKD